MQGSNIDGVFKNFAIPYESALYRPFTDAEDNELRLVGLSTTAGSSLDCYVTPGGSLQRRPAFTSWLMGQSTTALNGYRIDYVWSYTTLPNSSGTTYNYFLMTCYNLSTQLWEMFYTLQDGGGAITAFPTTRGMQSSVVPHAVGFSRGLAYVKAIPDSSTGEKLGTMIMDASTGSPVFRFWGMLGPTIPARISGVTTKLTVADTATSTTITVSSTTGFTTPTGTIQIDTDIITYTGTTATTFTGCTHGTSNTKAADHLLNSRVLQRDWSTAAHKVEVNSGWMYAYTWKSVTGQESNRSDIEFNPDLLPSDTLPFFGLIPKITVQGHSDTTNIPKICIYRTTDGGGSFLFLEEITNTGAGSITYEDKSLGTGASSSTKQDPLPDTKLDTTRIAPSLTSNSPPPSVNPPLVVGTDTPSRNITQIANYSSRFWYAIDNVVYYSGDEEISTGIPEESWPSGVAGNFFRFPDRIIGIQATSSSLYILGAVYTYVLSGTSKDTFNVRKIASHAGMGDFGRYASVSFLDRVAFIADDGRVMVITGDYIDLISEPVIQAQYTSFAPQMHFYTSQNVQWLMILDGNRQSTTSSIYVYDWTRSTTERRDFWFPPWTGKLNSLCPFQAGSFRLLAAITYDGTSGTKSSGILTMNILINFGTSSDVIRSNGAWSTSTFQFAARIQPFKNPPGNHVNTHGIPQLTTVDGFCKLDYYAGGSTSNIGLTVFYDTSDMSGGSAETANQVQPTRRNNNRNGTGGYMTREWRFWTATNDVALLISPGDLSTSQDVRLDRIAVGLIPAAGPDSSPGGENAG